MAQAQDLMGLSMPPQLAQCLGATPVIATASGSTAGDAKKINGQQKTTMCFAGTSAFALPQVGGDGPGYGALLNDEFWVVNFSGADLKIFAANNAAGSAVTFYARGASTAGTTGVTLVSGYPAIFKVITASTYLMLNTLASA